MHEKEVTTSFFCLKLAKYLKLQDFFLLHISKHAFDEIDFFETLPQNNYIKINILVFKYFVRLTLLFRFSKKLILFLWFGDHFRVIN
jgi:hypothetical protein